MADVTKLEWTSPADLRRIASEFMRLMAATREPVVMQELSALADYCLARAREIEAWRNRYLREAAE
jgi:hypothetical protein